MSTRSQGTPSLGMTTEEECFIRQLHTLAQTGFIFSDGLWRFEDTAELYQSSFLKALAQREANAGRQISIRGDYNFENPENTMNALYSEALFSGFLQQPVDTFIDKYNESLGNGDGQIDGYVYGVSYDLKTTTKSGNPSRIPGGRENPLHKHLYVFSSLVKNQAGFRVFTLEGYAWRNEALPHFFKDAEQDKPLRAKCGYRVSYTVLKDIGILETNVSKLRDGSDKRFFQLLKWDYELKRPIWKNPET